MKFRAEPRHAVRPKRQELGPRDDAEPVQFDLEKDVPARSLATALDYANRLKTEQGDGVWSFLDYLDHFLYLFPEKRDELGLTDAAYQNVTKYVSEKRSETDEFSWISFGSLVTKLVHIFPEQAAHFLRLSDFGPLKKWSDKSLAECNLHEKVARTPFFRHCSEGELTFEMNNKLD